MELVSPYRLVLGDAFDSLHPHVQVAHLAPLVATGGMNVTHGTGFFARRLVRLMNLPQEGSSQPVQLTVEDGKRAGEILWRRTIGKTKLATTQVAKDGHLVERSGPARVSLALRAEEGSLVYSQEKLAVLGIPVPVGLSPKVEARVSPSDSGWHVSVAIRWRNRLICQYSGEMRAT